MQRVAIVHNDKGFMDKLEKQLWNVCNVSVYFEGASFLKNLQYNAPDVVFIDEQLPDYSGENIVNLLREAGCNAPVVMYVGSPDVWHRAKSWSGEALELVQKGTGSFNLVCRKLYSQLWLQKLPANESESTSKKRWKLFKNKTKEINVWDLFFGGLRSKKYLEQLGSQAIQ